MKALELEQMVTIEGGHWNWHECGQGAIAGGVAGVSLGGWGALIGAVAGCLLNQL